MLPLTLCFFFLHVADYKPGLTNNYTVIIKLVQQNLIDHSQVATAFTGRGEELSDIRNLTNFSEKSFIILDQIHSNHWQEIPKPQKQAVSQTDAAVTFNPNLVLTVHVADCVPLLFFHPGAEPSQKSLVGVIHAGRKGLEEGIVAKVFSEIIENWSLNPQLFLIWVGPHICFDCYQIDRQTDLHYDLSQTVTQQLKQALGKNYPCEEVIWDERCTHCQTQELYSYRRQSDKSSHNQAAIALLS